MILTKIKGQRMWGGTSTSNGGSSSGGSGGSGGGGGTVDFAQNAEHANSAGKLDANSSDWNKIARKDIAQTIAEAWTFAKGIISTLVSKFYGGIEVTGGIDTDVIETSGDVSVGGNLEVDGDLLGHDASFEDVTMETLNVSKEAHFTKLVIDELLSNKGAIIISSANCTAEMVKPGNGYYDVYFSKVDRDGNAVENPWLVNDQAICMTFDGLASGTFSDVSNRYYWRLVTSVTEDSNYPDYHRIRLSDTTKAGSTVPMAGDDIVQLGYRGSGNAYRKSATILSSYPTMDTGVTPPALVFYKGINDFDLVSHRYTFVDGVSNEFIGNFKVLINNTYKDLATLLITMEEFLASIQKRTGNILPLSWWTDSDGNELGSANYDQTTQMYSNAVGSSYDDVVFSPIFWLPAGTYCFSCYPSHNDLDLWVYESSTNEKIPNDMGMPSSSVGTINHSASGSYQGCDRKYVTFTLSSGCYVCMNIYKDDGIFQMYRPQLEEGTEPTEWTEGTLTQIAQIKINADKIGLHVDEVEDGLSATGIDITAKTITCTGSKFIWKDQSNNNLMWLDSGGNANFEGKITATGGDITGPITVGVAVAQRTIIINPGDSWGSSIVGKESNTEKFRLSFSFDGLSSYHPLLRLTDGNSTPDKIEISEKNIIQNILDDSGQGYSITMRQGRYVDIGTNNSGTNSIFVYGTVYSATLSSQTNNLLVGMNDGQAYLRAVGPSEASAWPGVQSANQDPNYMIKGRVYAIHLDGLSQIITNPSNRDSERRARWAVLVTRIADTGG